MPLADQRPVGAGEPATVPTAAPITAASPWAGRCSNRDDEGGRIACLNMPGSMPRGSSTASPPPAAPRRRRRRAVRENHDAIRASPSVASTAAQLPIRRRCQTDRATSPRGRGDARREANTRRAPILAFGVCEHPEGEKARRRDAHGPQRRHLLRRHRRGLHPRLLLHPDRPGRGRGARRETLRRRHRRGAGPTRAGARQPRPRPSADARRNASGVVPSAARNTRIRCGRSEKPVSAAIRVAERPVVLSRCFACSSRITRSA